MSGAERSARYRERNREAVRAADRAAKQARRAADPQRERDLQQAYRDRNVDSIRLRQQAMRDADPAAWAARQRKWVAANPDKARATARSSDARRRSVKKSGDLTAQDWSELLEEWQGLCAYCREKPGVTQDHVVPLARGGRHTRDNVVPACLRCNQKKGSRLLCEWYGFVEVGA